MSIHKSGISGWNFQSASFAGGQHSANAFAVMDPGEKHGA
jgi:hypothetical protein